MGDDQLLAGIATQDQNAFQELYGRYAAAVYRYALSILRAPHLAEDVLQETMLAVWKGADRFRGGSKVLTWIFGIARNQAHNALRQEAKGRRLPNSARHESSSDPTQSMHRDLHVRAALDRISTQHREVMHLVFYEGLTVREAALVLGIPEGTVKSRMHHARKALAKELA